MLPCRRMRWLPVVLWCGGCKGLDKVPIVVGADDDEEICAQSREEDVACTLDGDTFQVEVCGGESVRMLGVDAPEIAHTDTEVADCWGDEAAAWLADFLEDATVRLSFDATCEDAYGRTLAYVWIDEVEGDEDSSILVNEEIIRAGQARFYTDFGDIRLRDRLEAAEAAAKAEGLGLWADCE
jgi:micrococcal nuclease